MKARYEAILELVRSDDYREGPAAFAQKRKPDWKGR
jgi:1,4-dihydroxy-2-naphthoyl-CoA synthase